mmetsp:Transcript_106950/g.310498  ORF Transcript_106950/g.310498 Transcript_106950/m.310498 type:complete len:635 (-) Transcript_106950:232-2136(-)
MKMLVVMALFVACWAPGVAMALWTPLGLPNSDVPGVEVAACIGVSLSTVLSPVLNCVLFEHYRAAVMTRIPISAPFITAVTIIVKKSFDMSTATAPLTNGHTKLGATTMLGRVYNDMSADEAAFKDQFDAVWAKLCTDAGPGADTALFALLEALVQQNQAGTVAQDGIQSVTQLMELSHRHNKHVQSVFKRIADECDAEYHAGPVKDLKRVQAKADTDYEGDVARVVDTVRASIIFRDLAGLTKGASILLAGDGASEVPLQVIRTKDRITHPLDSGYRDVLMNVVVPSTDGLVVELQLHLHEIVSIKPAQHKVYSLFRVLGLDQRDKRGKFTARLREDQDSKIWSRADKERITVNYNLSSFDKGEMLLKLYSEMEAAAVDYKRQFDASWSKYVGAEPGADALLFLRLKLLSDMTKDLSNLSATVAIVNGEDRRNLEAAFEGFAAASGAEYDAHAVSNSTPGLNGLARHHHSGSLTYESIGGLTNAVGILIAKGVRIVMTGGGEETLTPVDVTDRVTMPEPTGHRYVVVSVMVLSTGGLVADVELHLADIAKIRPEQWRNESKFRAMQKPSSTVTAASATTATATAAATATSGYSSSASAKVAPDDSQGGSRRDKRLALRVHWSSRDFGTSTSPR